MKRNSTFIILITVYFMLGISRICNAETSKQNCDLADITPYIALLQEVNEIKSEIEHLKNQIPDLKLKELPIFDIRYDVLPKKCQAQRVPRNCGEATLCTRRSGFYHIRIDQYSNDSFLVECDAHTENGDWTVIQRRRDGSIDFYRNWSEYKMGFGDIEGEFFIGLDKIHALTNYDGPQELMVLMENGTNAAWGTAKYDVFQIGDESEQYKLKKVGRYTGNAGDSLKGHLGMKFSTKDQDNDLYEANCAVAYMGAWWYTKCHSSNLNGHYGDKSYAKGVDWVSFSGHYNSLTFAKMMIRRRRNEL